MQTLKKITIRGGSPFEKGVQYGRLATEQIRSGVEHYRWCFTQSGMRMEEIFAQMRQYLQLVEKEMPDLAREAEGIAQGAGLDMGDIMMLNCRYELSKFPKPQECTSFAVLGPATKSGGAYAGQNWDNSVGLLDNLLVIHMLSDDGSRILGIAEAGQLIRHGMNTHGLSISSNNLQSVHDRNEVAIPTCFLRRKVLDCKTIAQAEALIRGAERKMSCNYLLCSGEQALDLEAYPGGCDAIAPLDNILTHANHFEVQPQLHALRRSPRGVRLRELLAAAYDDIDAAHIQRCLSDHANGEKSLCHHPENPNILLELREITVAGEIFDFAGGLAHFCYGPPLL